MLGVQNRNTVQGLWFVEHLGPYERSNGALALLPNFHLGGVQGVTQKLANEKGIELAKGMRGRES